MFPAEILIQAQLSEMRSRELAYARRFSHGLSDAEIPRRFAGGRSEVFRRIAGGADGRSRSAFSHPRRST